LRRRSAGPDDGVMSEPRRITTGKRAIPAVVRALAADGNGIVGREQLLERGVSSSAIGRALRSGLLHRRRPWS
jgi:hypothetical protein